MTRAQKTAIDQALCNGFKCAKGLAGIRGGEPSRTSRFRTQFACETVDEREMTAPE
ncbi:MAG TPA: hypothetical protein VG055_19840 [Planctomycetaceae bacterium]|jgi:hypothetical protein|nr:hypothetical protein [Planctomycetaceae bacterium]